MEMKRYSAFPKASVLLEPHHQTVLCDIQDTSVKMQSVYFAAPADWPSDETVNYIIKEYKDTHDRVGKVIQLELCKWLKFW